MSVPSACFYNSTIKAFGCINAQILNLIIKNQKHFFHLHKNEIIQSIKRIRSCNFCTDEDKKLSLSGKKSEKQKVFVEAGGGIKKKIFPTTPKVVVENINGTKTTMYLEQAQKLAKHNGLKLLLIDKIQSQQVYKMVKGNINTVQNKNDPQKIKRFSFMPEISQHDTEVKLNQIHKLISKHKPVVIFIEKHNDPAKSTGLLNLIRTKLESEYSSTDLKIRTSGMSLYIHLKSEKSEDPS